MEIKEKFYKHMIDTHTNALKWYKRKLAMREDVEIEDIKEEDTKQVEMLTENK
jgi:uncharacterized protein (DUF305 family)